MSYLILTTTSLYVHHQYIGAFLATGGFVHGGIFIINTTTTPNYCSVLFELGATCTINGGAYSTSTCTMIPWWHSAFHKSRSSLNQQPCMHLAVQTICSPTMLLLATSFFATYGSTLTQGLVTTTTTTTTSTLGVEQISTDFMVTPV